MCGSQCETMKNHARNECRIFSERKVAPFSANESFMYEKIIILRGLLCKESDPGTWSRLADLESHSAERKQDIKGVLLTHSAVEFVQEACGLRQFTNEEIDHVVGALATNAFWNNDNTSNMEVFRSGSYLYYYGSLPAHSCIPNSAWTIQMNSEFHLRASVDTRAGEPITQLYTEATVGTLQRRSHLKETKYFQCSCTRCADPTELKTYFSAVKCDSCPDGYLLPISPLNEDSDWKCQTQSDCNATANKSAAPCGKTKSRKYVDELLQGIRTKINNVNDADDSNEKRTLGCISSLRKLIAMYTSTALHPNHFLIYEVENIIVQRISYLLATATAAAASDKLTVEMFQLSALMVELCRKSFRVTDVILPGWTTHRGRLLYFLQQGLTTSLFATLSRNQKNSKHKSDHVEVLKEIQQVRNEAKQILSTEPEGREEFMLHKYLSEPSERLRFIQAKIAIN